MPAPVAGSSAPPTQPPGICPGSSAAEQCDNLDNDCDGRVDGQSEPCGSLVGACRQGARVCTSGAWGACEGATDPADEVCEGQADEDCDGTIDNGCACTAGQSRECGSDVGSCAFGTQSCEGSVWAACQGGQGPSSETCDGQDQDCNGVVDDPFANLGQACSAGVGACARSGVFVCNGSGSASQCDATQGTPITEVCANTGDDDCDGDVDEAPDGGCCDDADCASTHRCGDEGACVPKTWCEQQSRPAGVAASDYACTDLEAGLPGAPWVTAIAGQGQITSSSARASSAPNSLRSQVNAETMSGNASDRGKLSWTAVGATSITSMSVAAEVNSATATSLVDDTGWVDLLCIQNDTRSFCLSHAMSTGYVGLQIVEKRTGSGVFQAICDVAASARTLAVNSWTRVELRASTSATIQLFVAGAPVAITGCTLQLSLESTATGVVGLHANPTTGVGYTAHFDNVVISARR